MSEGPLSSEGELQSNPGFLSQASKRFQMIVNRMGAVNDAIAKKLTPGFVVESARQGVNNNLAFLRQTYDLDIDMSRQGQSKDLLVDETQKLNLIEADIALDAIRKELVQYPKQYIKYANVKKIRLLRDIAMLPNQDGEEARMVGGFFDPETRELYLAVGRVNFIHKSVDYNFREAIHHELFHAGEWREIDDQPEPDLYEENLNNEWAQMNHQGRLAYLRDQYAVLVRPGAYHGYVPGFARRYGRSDEKEDRATIAAEFMISPQKIKKLIRKDGPLRAKVEKVAGFFERRSSGLMNREWFDNHLNGKIGEQFTEPLTLNV